MRKLSLVVVALCACTAMLFLTRTTAVGEDQLGVMDGPRGGPAGQTPWAGTFFAEMTPTWTGVVQFHADGTVWSCDQSDMGGIGSNSLNSPAMGSWKRSGPRQATYLLLFTSYDLAGEPAAYFTMDVVVEWDVGFNKGLGLIRQRQYQLSEDPLDPNQGSPAGEVPFVARRIAP